MSGKGILTLDFVEVTGNRPNDKLDILLKHRVLSDSVSRKNHDAKKSLRIDNLDPDQGGAYQVQVFSLRHRPVNKFVKVFDNKAARNIVVLPIDPAKISKIEFPSFGSLGDDLQTILKNSQVEGNETLHGEDLYTALDDTRKAGLLNIYTKMKATKFESGRDVFSYFSAFTRVRGSRLFAKIQKELRDEVKNSIHTDLFHEVSGAMHTPPPNFQPADSFKTLDLYGNLQLSFFSNPQTLEFLVDVDIDDAQGIEHIFQVVGHTVSGKDSNPFDIHQILMEYQKLDPGYTILT